MAMLNNHRVKGIKWIKYQRSRAISFFNIFQLPLCLVVRKNFNRCFTPCLPILWEDSKLKTINLHSLVRQCFTNILPTITAFQFVPLSDVLMALMTLPMLLTEIVVSKSILGICLGFFRHPNWWLSNTLPHAALMIYLLWTGMNDQPSWSLDRMKLVSCQQD